MENFDISEFDCPCCGANKMMEPFLDKLDAIRDAIDVPFIITSGYRCPLHNKKVGGSATSSHMKGLAGDIACSNSKDRYSMIPPLAIFGRMGIRKDFIHVDMDDTKPQGMVWLY